MLVTPLLWFLGCAAPAPTPAPAPVAATAPAATAPATPEGTANAAEPANDLPDLTANLKHGLCDNGPGNEGADGYFAGDWTIDGTSATGTEQWILFTNPKWAAKGGKDCAFHWTITGTPSDKGACPDCDFGVSFHAAFQDNSDCPADMVHGHKAPTGQTVGGEGVSFDEKYAFKKDASGHLTVYFAKDGKRLGEGYWKGTHFNYLSDHKCNWF